MQGENLKLSLLQIILLICRLGHNIVHNAGFIIKSNDRINNWRNGPRRFKILILESAWKLWQNSESGYSSCGFKSGTSVCISQALQLVQPAGCLPPQCPRLSGIPPQICIVMNPLSCSYHT